MRHAFLVLLFYVGLLFPMSMFAHGNMMDFNDAQGSSAMMLYVEEQALDSEIHEDMEGLMEKMMSGTLTQSEADRLGTFMEEHPGPYGMMMNRFLSTRAFGDEDMMGWNNTMPGFWVWLCGATLLVWLAVGVLAIVWLWKQITKKEQH